MLQHVFVYQVADEDVEYEEEEEEELVEGDILIEEEEEEETEDKAPTLVSLEMTIYLCQEHSSLCYCLGQC